MKKMAIVSSYSESCGNAAFTKILHDTIRQYSDYEVDVVELDLPLLQSVERRTRAAASRHVEDLCKRLSGYAYVNIQLEAGLYGTLPGDVFRRLKKMMRANPNTSVTLHSPRLVPNPTSARVSIRQFLSLQIKAAVASMMSQYQTWIVNDLNRRLVREVIRNGHVAIVHTERARRQIRSLFQYDNVHVHPLRLVPQEFSPDPRTLDRLKLKLGLAPDSIIVGFFGYFTRNKGHLDALDALIQLPMHYKLVFFGRQHPQTIRSDGSKDDYLAKIVAYVLKTRSLSSRVFFLGELNDEEFLQVAAAVDLAWLPYYENGQDGSGIASIVMDVCSRVIASASFAFDELQKLIPYKNVARFDIGNQSELATKTEIAMRTVVPQKPFGGESVYNIRTQAQTYVNASKAGG